MTTDNLPEYVKKRVLILGCGNLLFGDDGFGPAAVRYIQEKCEIPHGVHVMDAGTGAGVILFTVALSDEKPEKIIVLDAVDLKRKPGEIFEISTEDLPENKASDFSLHQFPARNLLKEIRDTCGVEVIILACQVERVPEFVDPGLSKSVEKSLAKAAQVALELAKTKKARK